MSVVAELLEQSFALLTEIMRDPDEQDRIRHQLILASFEYHFSNNANYASYAAQLGVTPGNFEAQNAPLLPSSLFKRELLSLLSVDRSEIIKECTSSGTTGSLSIVPRDEITMLNFLSTIQASGAEYLGIERPGGYRGLVLGPDALEAGDLWFSYVLASLGVSLRTKFLERDGMFSEEEALESIRSELDAGEHIIVIGAPARILAVAERAIALTSWPAWTDRSMVVSAGGWKSSDGQAIAADQFRRSVASAFRIKNEESLRDSFNMVELNTIVQECAQHRMHVPPWLDVFAVDPRTNRQLADGATGILAYLDSGTTSFPGFILSDDFGRVERGSCGCGRSGKMMAIERRMTRIEARGCALKMNQNSTKTSEAQISNRYYASRYLS
jgi:long-chain-fatty-acid---luciferin-component ligase